MTSCLLCRFNLQFLDFFLFANACLCRTGGVRAGAVGVFMCGNLTTAHPCVHVLSAGGHAMAKDAKASILVECRGSPCVLG